MELNKITKKDFKEGILKCIKGGTTSVAPLGSSGLDIHLHGSSNKKTSRVSQVSVRLHNKDVTLLLTDTEGNFLFYGHYHLCHGVDFIAKEYFQIFKINKKWIISKAPKREHDVKENNPIKTSWNDLFHKMWW